AFGVVASLAVVTEPARETIRLSISTNVPDSGRSDQRVSAGAGKKKEKPFSPRRGGPPRGPPPRAAPGGAGGAGDGARPNQAAAGRVAGPRHAKKRTFARKGAGLLRRPPGQTAAENTPAASEPDRHELIIAGGKPRAGKAHQHAAVFDPARELVARLGHVADV